MSTTYVSSGQVFSGVVSSGDTLIVEDGGSAVNYGVYDGGLIIFEAGATGQGGEVAGTYPPSDPQEVVGSGASVTSAYIDEEGKQLVNGGVATNTYVGDGTQVVSVGLAISSIVSAFSYEWSEGAQIVEGTGVAIGTQVTGSLTYGTGVIHGDFHPVR